MRELEISIDRVRLWRKRWVEWQDMPLEECRVEIRLSDAPRSGSPGKFSAEQVTQIIAIACEVPQDSGYPVSHWTPQELAMEAKKRGIVASISDRQVGRFLKRGGSNVFFTLNLLAFLVHTAQHLVNGSYRLLRETLSVRRTFFNDLKALTRYIVFDSWGSLFAFMIDGLELELPPP
jgi:transposase